MTWIRTPLYTISTDFGGNYNNDNFMSEIKLSNISTATLISVGHYGDNITVEFNIEPTISEKTILDELVITHNNVKPIFYKSVISKTIKNNTIKLNNYSVFSKWTYAGSNKFGTIKQILGVGYVDASADASFSILIFDSTNGNTIAEQTFNNTTVDSILDLGTITNIPTDRSKIEISCKLIGGNNQSKAYIEDITFYI